MFKNEHERTADNVLREIGKLQRYVEANASSGDHPRWPDLEALLRLAAKEAARELQAEADRATFTHALHAWPDLTASAESGPS